MQSGKALFGAAFGAGLMLAGCAGPSVWEPMAQSNFAYPNSNVIPLKHTEGASSRTFILPFQVPVLNDARQTQEAINKALQASGGDIMIDGSYRMRSKIVPLFVVTLYTVDVEVDGTAGKMEIGKRNLQ